MLFILIVMLNTHLGLATANVILLLKETQITTPRCAVGTAAIVWLSMKPILIVVLSTYTGSATANVILKNTIL